MRSLQCNLALKPDGLFLAAILGGETLKSGLLNFQLRFISKIALLTFVYYMNSVTRELRIACTLAHMEREGGISPRLSPLAQVL